MSNQATLADSVKQAAAALAPLKRALVIRDNTLKISVNTYKKAFSEFLTNYFFEQGKVLQINGAVIEENYEDGLLSVTGTGSFLNIPDMPLTVQFALGENDEVVVSVVYTLISLGQSSNFWKFSRSFPDLPREPIPSMASLGDTDETDEAESPLDALLWNEAYCYVSSHDQYEPHFEIDVVPGINFIGKMRPSAGLGVIVNTLKSKQEFTVSGLINIPRPTQLFTPKMKQDVADTMLYPWDYKEEMPGIHLEAKLGIDLKIGNSEFKDVSLRAFSPLSNAWTQVAKFFAPKIAFTGDCAISEKIDIELIMTVDRKADILSVEAKCAGLSLNNLSDLADISGSGSLMAELPESLTSATKTLGKIELIDLAFTVSYAAKKLKIGWISFSLGIPKLNWSVWSDHIVVDSIGVRFNIFEPFATPMFVVDMWGKTEVQGVPIDVKASSADGWIVLAKLGEAQTLPLQSYLEAVISDAPPVPNLTIDDFVVIVAPGRFYQMSGSLADKPDSWDIDIGPQTLSFSNIIFDIVLAANGQKTGTFAGTIEIGKDLHLSAAYTTPGDFKVEAIIDKMKLSDLTEKLSSSKPSAPSGFDLTLTNSSILIKHDQDSNVFQVMTTVEDLGTLAFEARKVGSQSGIASGLSLSEPRLSSVPGMHFLEPIEKQIQLEELILVVSSFDGPQFQFPNAAEFSSHNQTSVQVQMPKQSSGLKEGLNFYGKWKLDTSGKEQKLLKKLLGLDPELLVTLQVGRSAMDRSQLFTEFRTKIQNNHPLDCKVGLALTDGSPEFFLIGSMEMMVQKKRMQFDVAMSFVSGGAFIAGSLEGTIKFGSVQLSNMALVMGVNWAGIPSLGLAATLDIRSFESSLAIFFDSADPSKSLLAGAISDLSLKDVVVTLAGVKKLSPDIGKVLERIDIEGTHKFTIPVSVTGALDHMEMETVASAFQQYGGVTIPSNHEQGLLVVGEKGKSWHFTDMADHMKHYQVKRVGNKLEVSLEAQFYVAPQTTYLGAMRYDAGTLVNAQLNILGLRLEAYIDINPYKGIAVDAFINKSIIILNEHLFKLSDAAGKVGPRVSIGTYNQPKHEIKQFRKPHFYITGRIEILGIAEQVYGSLSTAGLEVDLKGSLSKAIKYDVHVVLNHSQGFEVGGDLTVGVGTIDLGKLGKVHVNSDAEAKLDIHVDGKNVKVEVKAVVEALGTKHRLAVIKPSIKTKSLLHIDQLIANELKKILTGLFNDADKWASAVGKGLVDGVDDVEDVLSKKFGKAKKDIENIVKKSGIKKTGKKLEKAGKSVAHTAEKGAKKTGKAISGIFKKHKKKKKKKK